MVKGRPKVQVMACSRENPSDYAFMGKKCGLFRQKRASTPENCLNPLPKVIVNDPGQRIYGPLLCITLMF